MSQHRLPLLSLPRASHTGIPQTGIPQTGIPQMGVSRPGAALEDAVSTNAVGTNAVRTDAGAPTGAATAVGALLGILPQLLQVGDLAKESGKTIRALHLYEELELLRPAARSKGGFRLYAHEALVRIRWISKLQDMGLSLGDIQSVAKGMETAETAPGAMDALRQMYASKLDETRAQVEKLRALERELKASLDYLAKCQDVCEPTRVVTDCGSCELHAESCEHGSGEQPHGVPEALASIAELPDLIRGIRTLPAAKGLVSGPRPSTKALQSTKVRASS